MEGEQIEEEINGNKWKLKVRVIKIEIKRWQILKKDHWLELLLERSKISESEFSSIITTAQRLLIKLNNFIKSTTNTARNE